ncbi:MAG: N-acetyltransferase [Desulfamplus sp.]|nr:N-acetyltransferase [Desulfamplus sp.]MBF0388664.1 N-acetyltransferase [Desulfamplus sp.]
MLRKATTADVKSIHAILQLYGKRGELLARPLSELYDHIRDFWVYADDNSGDILGCSALQFCWEDLAEIRSVAVVESAHGRGIGTLLVDRTIQEAAAFKIPKLFTLTYRPAFFKRFGFDIIDRAELPIKIWSGCITCVNFPDCNEIAMRLHIEI